MFKWLTKRLVKNVRLGFATNSSSSHSLVFYGGDELPGNNPDWTYGFGWSHFVISDLPTKIAYGLTNFNTLGWQQENNTTAVKDHLRETTEDLLIELGIDPDEVFAFFNDPDAPTHVDHQSKFGNVHLLSREEQLQYLAMLADPNLVIHGGNDNGGLGPQDFFDKPGVEEVRRADQPFNIEVDLPYYYILREDELGFTLIHESWDKYNGWAKVEEVLAVGEEAIMTYIADHQEIFGECNFKLPKERTFPVPIANPTLVSESEEW